LQHVLRWKMVSEACCRRRFICLSWRHACHHGSSRSITFTSRVLLSPSINWRLDRAFFVALVALSLATLSTRSRCFAHSNLISFLDTKVRLIIHLRLI
jgi:hypothetical protein